MSDLRECNGRAENPLPSRVDRLSACGLLKSGLDPNLEATPDAIDLTPLLVRPNSPETVKFYSFGDFELLEEVARGGVGVVFRARQVSLNRTVALKFIHPGRLPGGEAVRRFKTEVELTARLEHPHIVPVYEVGECAGHPFFAMPLLTGGTLAQRITDPHSRFSVREAVRLLTKVARAVHYAHQHGIIHRDLKPGNILLDGQGEPHLTDFGLAKVLTEGQDLTQTVAVLGTPHYMAPEQVVGKAGGLGPSTDVYALGIILYELLTGHPPFTGGTATEILHRLLHDEPLAPRRCVGKRPADCLSLDRDLETVCLKCLRKEASERYGSAAALADDLDCWLAARPIAARPPGSFERFWRSVRRQPVTATVAVAAAAFAVIIFVHYLQSFKPLPPNYGARLAYTKGRLAWSSGNGREYLEARDQFLKAVASDPDYWPAWAGVAEVFAQGWLYTDVHPRRLRDLAEEAVRRPLAQSTNLSDAHLSQAHAVLGMLLSCYDWDWTNAFREFDLAVQLDPRSETAHYWRGLTLARCGRAAEAVGCVEEARSMSTSNVMASWSVGVMSYYAGDYDRAIKELHHTLELQPKFSFALTYLGMAHLAAGRVPDAIRQLEMAHKESPWSWSRVWLMAAYAMSTDPNHQADLERLRQPVRETPGGYASAYPLAVACAVRGETNRALYFLEQELGERSPAITWIKVDWPFRGMHDHPRFRELLRKVGLQDDTSLSTAMSQ